MKKDLATQAVYAAGILIALGLALWLRLENAQSRLFHADEGVQAYQAWRLIESGVYRYDPTEHHGPLLYHLTRWLSPLLTGDNGELSDFAIRLVPVAFSLATVALAIWMFRKAGPLLGLLWGAMLAAAPLAVIYGAYYVQESLLAFFTLAGLYALYRYLEAPAVRPAIAVGLCWGLMLVTKETAVIHIAASALAVGIVGFGDAKARTRLSPKALGRHLLWALAPVAILHVVFFSSFGAHPAGIWDGLATYLNYLDRAGGQGHEKPAGYYLALLWPHTREGIRWGELAFLVGTLIGLAFLLKRSEGEPPETLRLVRLVAVFGIAALAVYSAIPYKTPWLLLTSYCSLALAAAYGLVRLARLGPLVRGRWRPLGLLAAIGLGAWLAADLTRSARFAVFRYPSASRNAYLYEHTTPRYSKLLERLSQFDGQTVSLGVYSPDAAWPLPWHLREWENVGYWQTLESFEAHDLDLLDTRLTGDALPGTEEAAVWELYGLRPNTLLALRISPRLVDE